MGLTYSEDAEDGKRCFTTGVVVHLAGAGATFLPTGRLRPISIFFHGGDRSTRPDT